MSGELELWVSRSNLPLTLVILNPRRLSIFWHGLQARMARVLVFESQGAKGEKGGICWFCSDPGRRVQDQNTPSPDGRLLAVEGRVSNLGWRGIHLLDPRTICRSCGALLRRDLHFTPTGRVYRMIRKFFHRSGCPPRSNSEAIALAPVQIH